MKVIASFLRWAIILFLATSILAVVAYRFIPVYITPLMVIRCFEKGELKMHHHWVAMDDISRHMPVAVMASEDQRFLLHHGFDYNAIEKAAVHNIKNKTGKKRGASTITQQTAKNVFLWPGRSWIRKGFEVYFTALIAATLPNPIRFSSKAPSGYVRLRQRKIEHEMKFIPSFPKEGEDIDPNTTKGGIYHKKR